MKTNTTVSLLAAAVLTMLAGNANAQILPVNITSGSFNNDVILAGGSDGITNNTQGGGGPTSGGYDLASATYGAAHSFVGTQLPDNGTIASGSGSGAVFQLQPYTQNNVVIVQGTSETLTLATPTRFTDISVLLFGQASSTPATFTFTFAHGTTLTESTTQAVPYWVGGVPVSNPPSESAGVAATFQPLEAGGGQDGTPINFDEYDFTLGSPQKFLLLSSITVNGAAGQSLDVFAVSGTVGQVPEPSTWAMMIGGVGALIFVGRLRRNRASSQI